MRDLKNDEIENLIDKINDDPSDIIPNVLLRELIDKLNECEVYCPVEENELVFFKMGRLDLIPVFSNLDDFEKIFKDKNPEIFKFKNLKDFMTSDLGGLIFNPGSDYFIINQFLSKFIFNKNREKKPVSKGYDVKVRLNNYRPLTWKDLIIPENMTFMELDDVLKTLWGFNGDHLSCFLIKKDNLIIIDGDLSEVSMMQCDYEANITQVFEIFEKYDKITYWYDFGDDWQFDIEIKKKIDYDKDYVTIKRYKGKYNMVEDCRGVYGFSEIVYYAEHPEESDSSYYCELVEYLDEFDMDFIQIKLEFKVYIKSSWYGSVFFQK